MSKKDSAAKISRRKLSSYVTGFLASVYLTVTAYLLVVHHLFNGWALVMTIAGLALVQLVVQLVFFLHLGQESKPRWNLMAFLFMSMVVVIVVSGSLWIISNLNYHHHHTLSPNDTNSFIIHDEGYKK